MHIDPVHPSDDTVVRLQNKIENTLGLIDKELAYHDFDWDAHANTLKVDIVMPYSMQAREQEVCDALEAAFKDDIKLIYKIDYQ